MTADEMFEEVGYKEIPNTVCRKFRKGNRIIEINSNYSVAIYKEENEPLIYFDEIKAVAKAIEEMEEQQ